MAANQEDTKPNTKKFSKGERSIPHHSQRASKYYPAEDAAIAKKVRPRGLEEEDWKGIGSIQCHDRMQRLRFGGILDMSTSMEHR
jgi:hypothetical protein